MEIDRVDKFSEYVNYILTKTYQLQPIEECIAYTYTKFLHNQKDNITPDTYLTALKDTKLQFLTKNCLIVCLRFSDNQCIYVEKTKLMNISYFSNMFEGTHSDVSDEFLIEMPVNTMFDNHMIMSKIIHFVYYGEINIDKRVFSTLFYLALFTHKLLNVTYQYRSKINICSTITIFGESIQIKQNEIKLMDALSALLSECKKQPKCNDPNKDKSDVEEDIHLFLSTTKGGIFELLNEIYNIKELDLGIDFLLLIKRYHHVFDLNTYILEFISSPVYKILKDKHFKQPDEANEFIIKILENGIGNEKLNEYNLANNNKVYEQLASPLYKKFEMADKKSAHEFIIEMLEETAKSVKTWNKNDDDDDQKTKKRLRIDENDATNQSSNKKSKTNNTH